MRRSTPGFGSSTATSDPCSPSTARIFPSILPPCSGVRTFAQRPMNRCQSIVLRSGRSPGDDTCNTYSGDTNSPPSSRASNARDARAQSSTVTASPSRRSMRTSINGRLRVPPRLSSTRSNPTASSSDSTTSSSESFTCSRGNRPEQTRIKRNKKMWGASPTFHWRPFGPPSNGKVDAVNGSVKECRRSSLRAAGLNRRHDASRSGRCRSAYTTCSS
jgi:hypothetical protein